VDRRDLIAWMLATGGLAAVNRLSAKDLLILGGDAHRTPLVDGVLDAHATDAVTIAAEHIIPATDTPGATDARVPAFIAIMLAQWYSSADRDRFLAGVRDLDVRARAAVGVPFVEAPPAVQRAVLQQLDDDVSALRQQRAATANDHWFAMLKYLTVWGYCTSEIAMRQTLRTWPMPMRYDGNAAVGP
jgi:Gluconate 2-dehydrogenase subunit 3